MAFTISSCMLAIELEADAEAAKLEHSNKK